MGSIDIENLRDSPVIAVCCAASPSENEAKLAYVTGREIALAGAILVCGGLGGSMEAACRGAKDEGGLTVGILPVYEKQAANEYVDLVIPTGLNHARNNIVVACADGVIGVGGSWGTLSELAIAFKMGKPVATLEGWNVKHPGRESEGFLIVGSPGEAVQAVLGKISAG